ncbi:hypothetical protein FRC10_008407 [Ceratobasidium sp. 414]|nr:hypothetical protein FRC10_008407 [Ceratobasidium sp. 414]
MDTTSLAKLNVSQLKAKCKELKVVGYSKLAKASLIEKLVALELGNEGGGVGEAELAAVVWDDGQLPIPPPVPTQVATSSRENTSLEAQRAPQPALGQNVLGVVQKVTKKRPRKEGEGAPSKKLKKTSASEAAYDAAQHQSTGERAQQSNPPILPPVTALKPLPGASQNVSQGKFQVPLLPDRLSRAAAASTTGNAPIIVPPTTVPSTLAPTSGQSILPSIVGNSFKKTATSNKTSVVSKNAALTEPLTSPPTTFVNAGTEKIITQAPTSKTNNSTRTPLAYKYKKFKTPTIIRPTRINSPNKSQPPTRMSYPRRHSDQSLDFVPLPTCTDFPRIKMPPSASRRRQAERMSVVFSGISDRSVLALCVQVSRAWRYAVYLSATHTLMRDFPGSRLNAVQANIKEPRMTSMWAYLRARQKEAETRRKAFEQTWLGRCIQKEDISVCNRNPVSAQMWTSPDDERQIVVALRFVCTRLVFALARRHDGSFDIREWLCATVVGAHEVVPNEIWRVATARPHHASGSSTDLKRTKFEAFYILFDTGEVIGHAPPPGDPGIIFGQRIARNRPHLEVFGGSGRAGNPLRADWAKYIEAVERRDAVSLQDAITSADRESYVAGVSAFWLRSLADRAEGGGLLRTIARRVSGIYKAVTGMAQELACGGPADLPALTKRQLLGLLVSEHHLIESVHLEVKSPRVNTRLHSALALVLTAPGREYFVLRDTGTPIGTSDEGLEVIWQELMGCDAWGRVSAETAK